MARFVNPYKARFSNPDTQNTDIGAGMSNIMQAMFANRATAGPPQPRRDPSQDMKDQADAEKALAEAANQRQVTQGRTDFVPNFVKSLVPESEVPLVTERSQTGIWPAFEDPRRQQSVAPDVGPLDWNPEKDAQLNDAKRISAALIASKDANFKDVNEAINAPGNERAIQAIFDGILPSRGGAPAATQTQAIPQLPITAPGADAGIDPSSVPIGTTPTVDVNPPSALDLNHVLEGAMRLAAKSPERANSLISGVNSARQLDEQAMKANEMKQYRKPVPGAPGLDYDSRTNSYYLPGSNRPATGPEISEWLKSNKGPLVQVDAFDKKGDQLRAKSAQDKQDAAMRVVDFASVAGAAANALEGFSGGWTAELQAKLGRLLPESEYGKIASVADLARGLRARMAPQLRATGSGATSDLEFSEFMSAFPSLSQTPDGRRLIADVSQKIADREVAASDIYGELAAQGPVKISEWRRRVREQVGDLFTPQDKQRLRGGGGAAASQPSRQEVEAEARRRGLLK